MSKIVLTAWNDSQPNVKLVVPMHQPVDKNVYLGIVKRLLVEYDHLAVQGKGEIVEIR